MKKFLLTFVTLFSFLICINAQNDVMMQAFYWNVPVDDTNKNGDWWDNLRLKADQMKSSGITGIWIPSPAKGNWGISDMGYGIYDHYDLGNYNQKGSIETRFGSRTELENMIAEMHNTTGGKQKINVYADIVLNHLMANHDSYQGTNNLEANPAVKGYVFDEAYRNGTQYTPYPTNEIYWVIPNAAPGDYYIKIKGYNLDYSVSHTERGYDLQIDWTGAGYNTSYGWESEPNNGGGNTDDFPGTGQTMRGHINYQSDIDEYKVSLTSTHDIVMKLTARKENSNPWEWAWASQTNGFYPFEIWHNGQNLANTSFEAQTFTHVHYVTHTGTGEPNYAWHYDDFHPVDQNDFLTDWNWGGSDAIIPNTKGFGHDLNTFSTTVQDRMEDWGEWLSNQIQFDGYRLDFVRGFQEDFVSDWINSLPLLSGNQRFIVGEYWTENAELLKNWVNTLDGNGADADVFDFPLRTDLKNLCMDDSYKMYWLNHAGMVRNTNHSISGTSVVTWLDNHDTGKEWDKWVTKDWWLAHAYILTHEGRPCLFYPHYYGGTLESDHNGVYKTITIPSQQNSIDDLIYIRNTYLGGDLEVLTEIGNPWPSSNTDNVYVARREGNGTKDGAIIVINNSYETKGVWVDATPSGWSNWTGQVLKNAFNGSATTVYSSGRVWVEAPSRGYSVYVKSTDYVPIDSKMTLSVEEDLNTNSSFKITGSPNPFTNSTEISVDLPVSSVINIAIYDIFGRLIDELYSGQVHSGVNKFTWNSDNITKGVYFAIVSYNNKKQTIKLVKN